MRRQAASVPKAQAFATKPTIALAQIRRAIEQGVRQGVVLANAGYGDKTAFRHGSLPWACCTRWASDRPPPCGPLPPKAWVGRCAKPTKLRPEPGHEPVSVKALAMGVAPMPCTSLRSRARLVTSDCKADCLQAFWAGQRPHFPKVDTLVLNLDNGPECHSRRTQFMARMVQFAQTTGLTVRLAYYLPYHSKYNPIERCWGVLEHHWNGRLLNSVEAVQRFAASMTWKAMRAVEDKLERLPELGKWLIPCKQEEAFNNEAWQLSQEKRRRS